MVFPELVGETLEATCVAKGRAPFGKSALTDIALRLVRSEMRDSQYCVAVRLACAGDATDNGSASEVARVAWLDAAKAVSILLVVLVHATTIVGGDSASLVDTMAHEAYDIMLPTFYLASGILFRPAMHRSARDLLVRKVAPTYWVMLVWSIPVALYCWAGRTLGPYPHLYDDAKTTGVRLLLSPIVPNAELWFLWVLVACYLMAYALRRAPWALLLLVAASPLWVHLPSVLGNFFRYGVFFFIGLFIGDALVSRMRTLTRVKAALLLVCFSLAYAAISSTPEFPAKHLLAGGIGVGVAVCCGRVMDGMAKMRLLGQRTLWVYVMHSSLLMTLSLGLVWVRVASPLLPGLVLLSAGLVTVASCYLGSVTRNSPMFVLPEGIASRLGTVNAPAGRAQ